MVINKLVDPGEVYVIGQYELGTNNPTGLYKIGIVQNERSTYHRLPEHQTGNPNRLFISECIPAEASYLVEQQMHRKWNSKRVSQEWFDLSAPGDYAQVVADIHAMEGQFGPQISQLRNVYYLAPTVGNNTTLSSTDLTLAQQLRDQAFDLLDQMARLKYKFSTLECQIKLTNGQDACVDSVSTVKITNPFTEFSKSKLPSALRQAYMNKPRKRLQDFRYIYTQTGSEIDSLKLDSAFWKNRYPTEFALFSAEKTAWKAMEPGISIASVNRVVQPRTSALETMHEEYVDAIIAYGDLKLQKEGLEIQTKILCNHYQGIEDVCSWKRKEQSDEFNLPAFKVLEPAAYADPAHQVPKGDTAKPEVIKFKTW
jgi:hypothetical protein|tara:strand:+ start:106 stop:1212 length:1107 start_codon:yes stop_codon:yes gene_type:complete